MAAQPVAWMAATGLACGLLLRVFTGPGSTWPVVLGTVGPLAAAMGTWLVVARVFVRAPAQVPGVMIKLFGAKLLLFAAYIATVVLLLLDETTAFVVSFTCQYILLHAVQAVYLRRLLAGG